MDASETNRGAAPLGVPHSAEQERWRELVSAVGSEIASPLTAAMERIQTLIATGRIDRTSLRALRDEVEGARRAGMIAQQLTRFASGRLRQSHERLSLAQTLQSALDQRPRETAKRGIALKPPTAAADVIVDASLLFSLLNALLDWTLTLARSNITFEIDLSAWPAKARLVCSFATQPKSSAPADAQTRPGPALDSLTWRLTEQTAKAMDLPLTRSLRDAEVTVSVEFARTASDHMEGVSAIEPDAESSLLSTNSKPMAGSHVLVIASRREMRVRVCDSIRHLGLLIDLVTSVDEAAKFCRESLPDAIVVEGILRGERLNYLRAQVNAQRADFPFIEITEEGADFQMSGYDGKSMGRVGRDAIETALATVLTSELSKTI